MFIHKLFQSPHFLFFICLIPLLLVIIHYYSKLSSTNVISSVNNKDKYILKIIEINDREPTYKLATYEGYKYSFDRIRSQAKLIENLKLYDKCRQNPKTIVVDIGASLGEFSLYAGACGCQVYMFEIEPRKVSLIEKSIKLNSFESRIHLIKKAVSDLSSNNKVYFSKNISRQLFNPTNIKSDDIYSAETINLNQFQFPSEIYLLRVDVQGYELNVFRSAEKLFRENRINHVLFEYTPWGSKMNFHKEIFSYMKHILNAKQFYALHPKEPVIYGPLNDGDLNEFYSQHTKQVLQRDIYARFTDEQVPITSQLFNFESSF